MDIDLTFSRVADELINRVFNTAILYRAVGKSVYNPRTGSLTPNSTDHNINAGIISRSRTEGGGVAEAYALTLWVEHGTLPTLPKTDDLVIYDSTTWRVTEVAPTYSSKGLIASKIIARAS